MAHALRRVPSDLYWSTLLLNSLHNNDNPQTITARQAAEALFTPKQEHRAPASEPESAVERKPRILAALPRVSPNVASTVIITPTQETQRAIPRSQIDRIRTWLRFGMTIRQAADACGVSVSELKEALRPSAW
jgi:hypothetical protein